MTRISISPAGLAKTLAVIVAILLLAHLTGLFMRLGLGHESVFNLVPLFDFRIERNFPTFYSSSALLLAASLTFTIAVHKLRGRRPYRVHWFLLAIIFFLLACDEAMTLHEHAIPVMRSLIDARGLLYFAWVVPYAIAVLIFGLAYLPFLLALPRRTAILFVTSGLVFCAGALGFESLSAAVFEATGSVDDFRFIALYTIEELLEMTGIVIFIYALSDYLDREIGGLHILLTNQRSRQGDLAD